MHRRRGRFRLARVAAGVAAAAGTLAWAAGAVVAAPAVAPGHGSAQAFTAAVVPKAGSLSVGVTLGEALAGHTNRVAKAQSQTIDLGAIGTSLTGYNCGSAPTVQPTQLPQPLIVETGDAGAARGVSEAGGGGVLGQLDGPAFTRYGQATAAPYARAATTILPFALPGVASVGSGISASWSGLVAGQRQAGATTDISGLSLPGGVTLSGLHWSAVDQSTGPVTRAGAFSIAHAAVGGVPLPTVDPSQTLARVNAVLNPLGINLGPPTAHLTQGIEYVDPLEISVVPNATRDGLLNTVLSGIQPVRQQVFQAVLQAVCQSDTAITVADVAIGSISGAGTFNVLLGGVQATSGAISANGFDLGPPGVPDLTGRTPSATSPATAPAGPEVPTAGFAIGPQSTPAGRPAVPAARPSLSVERAVGGRRGGALLAVGLIGLALLTVMAEADRRTMRRRGAAFEE